MNRFSSKFAALFIASALALTPVVSSASPVSISASGSTEITQAYTQGWISKSLKGPDQSQTPITAADFAALLKAAAQEAGQTLSYEGTHSTTTLTREQAASIVNSFLNVPSSSDHSFKDIPANSTYKEAITAASQSGLIRGKTDSLFGYGQPVTRGEAAVIANRLYSYLQPFQITEATIMDMQQAMESGRLTSEELVQLYLDRIEKYDQKGPALNSILTINSKALEIAKALDEERLTKGARGPLHGIPVIVKDNYDTADMPTTSGNIGLKDVIPPDDATQVKLLKEAGAIILAKANLHEFAFGYTTVSSLGGQTLNPYNLSIVPGGSSGGTGAAVAANLAAVGMGSDTGGSIRIPSSFNSLVGIRPTIGLSSRDGIAPLALTQDTGGPMARSVADAALVLNATAAYDPKDVATARGVNLIAEDYTDYLLEDGLKGARIGIVREVFGTNPEVNSVIEKAIQDMKLAGAVMIDNVTIPNFDKINQYGSLSGWEFKFQFNDYLTSLGDKAPYRTLDELIKSGKFDPSIESMLHQRNDRPSLDEEEYKDIVLYRTRYVQDAVLKMMADNKLDALIFPTSANPPVSIGEEQTVGDGFKLSSFTGWPTITVPAGYTSNGLPIGMDFFGRAFSEPKLIELAYSYEQHTKHRKAPKNTP